MKISQNEYYYHFVIANRPPRKHHIPVHEDWEFEAFLYGDWRDKADADGKIELTADEETRYSK
jgi:hypothetical protein